MAHVTIEYVIMLPLLVLQIFLFPLTASWLMDIWVNSRDSLALKDCASHLGSTMLQLYSTLNHATVSAGTVTYTPELPPFIENHPYTGTANLSSSGTDPNASKILTITLTLSITQIAADATVTLGPNVSWQSSTFISNSTDAIVTAQKRADGTISLKFGG